MADRVSHLEHLTAQVRHGRADRPGHLFRMGHLTEPHDSPAALPAADGAIRTDAARARSET